MTWHTAFQSAFASSVISHLANKLIDIALTEIGHITEVEENLRELATRVCTVQDKFDQLDDVNLSRSVWKPWLYKLTTLCYDVDDIIDSINLEIQRREQPNNVSDEICSSNLMSWFLQISWLMFWQNDNNSYPALSSSNRGQVRRIILSSLKKWNLPHKISKLIKKLQKIDAQVDAALRVQALRGSTSHNVLRNSRSSSSLDTWLQIPSGRQSDIDYIIRKYLKRDGGGGGICIVGMAGLGKTVLARSIINDDRVRGHFEFIWWASAPKGLSSVENISIEVIDDGHTAQPCINGRCLRQSGHRSLLVLDDLWDVQHRAWEDLVSSVIGFGSTVIITSRDPGVASITGTTLYYLKRLSDEDCKELIRGRVSEIDISDYDFAVFESKADQIAKKCGGLPLVADVLGLELRSMCRKEEPESAITHLEETDLWELPVFRHQIFPDLGLNKANLPRELSKFLAYLALFPPGHCFSKHELTQLWMAEGFIEPECWETLKTANFDSLSSRSMLQVSHVHPKGSPASTYRMHEFTHRFAESLASNTCLRIDEGNPSFLPVSDTRHLSLCSESVGKELLGLIETYYSGLRTLLMVNEDAKVHPVPRSLFQKLRYLRVLTLSRSNITELPGTIGNLKHLRYLDASDTPIEKLPIAICGLLGLRVLKLKSCKKLQCLPRYFARLVNLVLLELDMLRLSSTPPNLGKLTNLQTLHVFIVNKGREHLITELKDMNALQGSTKIMKLENVTNKAEARDAKLHRKSHLKRLELEWTKGSMPESSVAEDILTGLQPHDSLTELQISNYSGIKFPRWLCHLKNLGSIYLYNCPDCTELPPFGQLPLLKSLKIDKMCNLRKVDRGQFVGHQYYKFPALELLEFLNMQNLVKWRKLLPGDMPHLRELKFMECPSLLSLPSLRHLTSFKRLWIVRCPNLVFLPDLPLDY